MITYLRRAFIRHIFGVLASHANVIACIALRCSARCTLLDAHCAIYIRNAS